MNELQRYKTLFENRAKKERNCFLLKEKVIFLDKTTGLTISEKTLNCFRKNT